MAPNQLLLRGFGQPEACGVYELQDRLRGDQRGAGALVAALCWVVHVTVPHKRHTRGHQELSRVVLYRRWQAAEAWYGSRGHYMTAGCPTLPMHGCQAGVLELP
jgi:hypothetical protein